MERDAYTPDFARLSDEGQPYNPTFHRCYGEHLMRPFTSDVTHARINMAKVEDATDKL